MKRYRQNLSVALALLLAMAMAVMVAGCNQDDAATTAYKTLKSGQITYDASLKAAADLDKRGRLTSEEKAQVIKVAETYRTGHDAAALALEIYVKTKAAPDAEKMQAAVAALAEVGAELSRIVAPLLTRQ